MSDLTPAEYDEDSDECPDCGFTSERARLIRTPRSTEFPCPSCVWAYGQEGG